MMIVFVRFRFRCFLFPPGEVLFDRRQSAETFLLEVLCFFLLFVRTLGWSHHFYHAIPFRRRQQWLRQP
jgi:hypothetical protein